MIEPLTYATLERYRALADSVDRHRDPVTEEVSTSLVHVVDALEEAREAIERQMIAIVEVLSERLYDESWHDGIEFTIFDGGLRAERESADLHSLSILIGAWPVWPAGQPCPTVVPRSTLGAFR